jgi:hypothetical protein
MHVVNTTIKHLCTIDVMIFWIFWWDWDLSSGLHAYKAGTHEPHFQSSLLWLFWKCDFINYLPRLASNLDPFHLSLPSR